MKEIIIAILAIISVLAIPVGFTLCLICPKSTDPIGQFGFYMAACGLIATAVTAFIIGD